MQQEYQRRLQALRQTLDSLKHCKLVWGEVLNGVVKEKYVQLDMM